MVSGQRERCASVFLLTCNLLLYNADVNWLPGSASPYGYSSQPILQFLLLILGYLKDSTAAAHSVDTGIS